MKGLNKKMIESNKKSQKLRILLKDENISWEKAQEIKELQDKEWKKFNFYKNISKKMR